MSVENNLTLVRKMIEAVDAKDWELIPSYFTESAIWNIPTAPGVSVTLRGMIEAWRGDAVAFPETKREIVAAFGDAERVCVEVVESGTHTGPMELGGAVIPPTGKQFRIRVCGVVHVTDGRISEVHVYYDPRENLVQLGLA